MKSLVFWAVYQLKKVYIGFVTLHLSSYDRSVLVMVEKRGGGKNLLLILLLTSAQRNSTLWEHYFVDSHERPNNFQNNVTT